jgi:hypothetical protein
MSLLENIADRTVARVETKTHLGPDAQVDNKNLIITPRRPELTDPFLALVEDWFSTPGFDWHPHRGLETVTLVVDGVLEHGDNVGNAGALTTGDVQWMTAGRGIIHRELAFRDERAHTLQLWLNLPAERKLTDSRYQDLLAARRPVVELDGTRVDVISGTASAGGDGEVSQVGAGSDHAPAGEPVVGGQLARLTQVQHRERDEQQVGGEPVGPRRRGTSDPLPAKGDQRIRDNDEGHGASLPRGPEATLIPG